jgi:phosphoribosylanthranilate isomerase
VDPDLAELVRLKAAGFDFFQLHFADVVARERVAAWSEAVGPGRLWLAPRLPPEADPAEEWLPLADTFLLDAYRADGFGGSGRTGNWDAFKRHQVRYPAKTWILAGGLNPGNIAEAVRRSGAGFVDVNSGVERSPGVKDPVKLEALVAAMRLRSPAAGA